MSNHHREDEGKAYVGTTDTFYDNEKATPLTTQEDRDYLINAINYMFPTVNVKDEDIESTWAGIRPLILEKGKDPSEISRKDVFCLSHHSSHHSIYHQL
ncbi:FAD-dependent oxidoreductase [Micromonospora chersina]